MKPEFDSFSDSYEKLLKDPIRDRFMGGAGDFFHTRKRDLIRNYFAKRGTATYDLAYLDLGCGKGELAVSLCEDFGRTCGCDPSEAMMRSGQIEARGIETLVQEDPEVIPFPDGEFDFVSAVCVYHHVPLALRGQLTAEAYRVLKPGGTFVIIEHNPYNPVTQGVVKRTPIDADAILLKPTETLVLLRSKGFAISELEYFLYLPETLYRNFGRLETMLRSVPLGGQYAAFGERAGVS